MSEPTAAVARSSERLLTSTSVVGGLTLLSRVTGLARDMALSHWLGAGPAMDAFTVAFKLPNLLRRFFAEGAFSQAFVPVIAQYRTQRTHAEARELVDRTAGTLALALFAVTAVGVLAAPALILVFAPGFAAGDDRFELATGMLRLTFPYVLFISLTAFAGAILNSYRRFAPVAFTPVLLNLVVIGFAAWVEPNLGRPGIGIAAGVLVAGVVQLGFQLPFLWRLGLLPRPKWGATHTGVRRICKLMLPALFGSSITQISLLLDTLIASFLAAGSISWLYYADRLVEFPLGVLGIAVATVILPRLADHHASASARTFDATLDWALKLVILAGVPAAVGLALLATPLMTTLFFRGAFTEEDVRMAALGLCAYAPGLLGFILVKVLSPGYFARADVRTPVRAGVQALGLGMLGSVTFVAVLAATGWAPAHVGIAAATSLSGIVNATLLLRGLARSGIYRPRHGWRRLLVQVSVATLAMAGVLALALARLPTWFTLGAAERVAGLAALVGGAALVYFAACYALGLRPRELAPRTPI